MSKKGLSSLRAEVVDSDNETFVPFCEIFYWGLKGVGGSGKNCVFQV